MREILFKAKAINRDKGYHRTSYQNGDWVYGLVTRLYDERFENLSAEMTDENGVSGIEIDHNTISQYTGLTDNNGNKIWENDVISTDCGNVRVIYSNDPSPYENSFYVGFEVIFENITDNENYRHDLGYWIKFRGFEVIGNIFDNPELIGEQNG